MTKELELCYDELIDVLEVEKRIDRIIELKKRLKDKTKLTKKFEQCWKLVDEWEEEAAICSSLAGDNKQAKHKSTWRAASGIKLASCNRKQVKCKSTWRAKTQMPKQGPAS